MNAADGGPGRVGIPAHGDHLFDGPPEIPRVSQPAVQGQGDRVIDVAADAPIKPEGVGQFHGRSVAVEMAFQLAEQAL